MDCPMPVIVAVTVDGSRYFGGQGSEKKVQT
jgi:hypothetical protein